MESNMVQEQNSKGWVVVNESRGNIVAEKSSINRHRLIHHFHHISLHILTRMTTTTSSTTTYDDEVGILYFCLHHF
ncbi:hypothetical protein ACFX19_044085 [Malus domestica]